MDEYFAQHARGKRLHFHRCFVGVDLGEGLAHRDFVAFFFKPTSYLPFFHRGRKLWHDDLSGHKRVNSES